jgi:uncharacterized protein (TIGR02266 family)
MTMERRSERHAANSPLRLRCESWQDFVKTYAADLSRGGMFIQTDTAPELLSSLELRLELPDGAVIALTARVVHAVTPQQAARSSQVAGIGVEFVHIDAEQKRQVQQLIDFARSQGERADPTASFTRTLLENTPSLPAQTVGERLSLLPTPSGAPRRSASRTNLAAVQVSDEREPSQSGQMRVARRGPSASIDPALFNNRVHIEAAPGRSPSGQIPAQGKSVPARPPSGPLSADAARARSSKPAARRPSAPLDPEALRSHSRQPAARAPTGPIAPVQQSDAPGANGPSPSGQAPAQPGPTDLNRLKLVLNSLAHKHYDDAARLAREMLADNPGDPQVLKWQAVCFARMALTRNDIRAAAEQYEKVLQYEDNNREARDFVRTFQREQKLNALPFGRYFVKKK